MLNEQQFEERCLNWFQENEWRVTHGPDIAPNSSTAKRTFPTAALIQRYARNLSLQMQCQFRIATSRKAHRSLAELRDTPLPNPSPASYEFKISKRRLKHG